MKICAMATVIVLLASPIVAHSQDEFPMLELPTWTLHDDLACYELSEARELAIKDREFRELRLSNTNCREKFQLTSDRLDELQAAYDELYIDFEAQTVITRGLESDLEASNSDVKRLLKRPHPAVAVLVSIGSALLGVVVGFGVGAAVGGD